MPRALVMPVRMSWAALAAPVIFCSLATAREVLQGPYFHDVTPMG
ncbi:hypothetical protein [Megasphaera sp. UBA4382]|nr:hypothetical protein [Megasphaera sp. UBA4382]